MAVLILLAAAMLPATLAKAESELGVRAPGVGSLHDALMGYADDNTAARLWPVGEHTLSGQVVDQDGKPVADCSVWVAFLASSSSRTWTKDPPPPMVVTNDQGLFEIRDLADGFWVVGASTPSAVYGFADCRVPDDPPVRIVIEPARGSIAGTVADGATGQPVEGATLRVRWSTSDESKAPVLAMMGASKNEATTDAQGKFIVEKLIPGSWSISGNIGAVRLRDRESKKALSSLEVGADSPGATVQLETYPGWTVSGRVTEHKTGKPLEGVVVSSSSFGSPASSEAVTDVDGRYRLVNVYPHHMLSNRNTPRGEVRLKKRGYRSQVPSPAELAGTPVQYHPFPSVELPAAQSEVNADFEMKPTLVVAGVVSDMAGNPLSSAEITCESSTKEADGRSRSGTRQITADSSGKFEFEVLPNTTVELRCRVVDVGYGAIESFEVIDQSVEGLKLVVQPGVSLAGVVRDANGGVPPQTHEVVAKLYTAKYTREVVARAKTKPDGSFRLTNLPPGKLGVFLERGQYNDLGERSATPITLTVGQAHGGIVIEVPVAQSFGGILQYTDGTPLANATVEVAIQWEVPASSDGDSEHRNGSSGIATRRFVTDSQGRFRCDPVFGAINSMTVRWGKNRQKQWQAANTRSNDLPLNQPDKIYTVELDEPITVAIAILDAKTLQPVPSARLCAGMHHPTKAEPDPDNPGTLIVRNVSANSDAFTLCIEADGYPREWVPRANLQLPTKLTAGSVVERQVLLYPPTPVTGRLVQKGTKSPVEGVEVTIVLPLEKGPRFTLSSATTDNQGRFALSVGSGNEFVLWAVASRPHIPPGDRLPAQAFMNPAPVLKQFKVTTGTPKDVGDIEIDVPTPP